MSQKDLEQLTAALQPIMIKPFTFNGLRFDVNYVYPSSYNASYMHAPHYHPWFEFVYTSVGSIYTSFNDKEFFIKSGESYLVPPGTIHSHRNNNEHGHNLCIRFAISADDNSTYCNDVIRTLSVPRPYSFNSGIEAITPSEQLYVTQAKFVLWIMSLYDNWSDHKILPSSTQNVVSPQVIHYLNSNYKNKIQTEDIARALNTSYRTLSRKFKIETGITITDMLTDIRLSKARQLLIETNKSISDIATEVGYDSEFYFSRVFKDSEKTPPLVYRKRFT